MLKLNLTDYSCTKTYDFVENGNPNDFNCSFKFSGDTLFFSRAEIDGNFIQYKVSAIDYANVDLISKYGLFRPEIYVYFIYNSDVRLFNERRVIKVYQNAFLEQEDPNLPANKEFKDFGLLSDFQLLSNGSCVVRNADNMGNALYIYDQNEVLCDSLYIGDPATSGFNTDVHFFTENNVDWQFYRIRGQYYLNRIIDNHFMWGVREKSLGENYFRGFNDRLIMVNEFQKIVQLTENGDIIDNLVLPENMFGINGYYRFNENILLFYKMNPNGIFEYYVQLLDRETGLPMYQGNGFNLTAEEDIHYINSKILVKDNLVYLTMKKANDLILRKYRVSDQGVELLNEYMLNAESGNDFIDNYADLVDIVEYGHYKFFIIKDDDYYYYRYLDENDNIDGSYNGYALFDCVVGRYSGTYLKKNNALELFFYSEDMAFSKTIYIDKMINYPDYNKPLLSNHSNYPNPFNSGTKISFYLNGQMSAKVEIYNIKGQKVRTLESGNLNKGLNYLYWDGKNSDNKASASGVYFYRITAGDQHLNGKMLYLK
jgi:hypothetical protein